MGVLVHKDFRGLHIGRALLLGALNHGCRELHLRNVTARVPVANQSLRDVLGAIGFRATASTEPSAAEIIMARPSSCDACRGERCPAHGKTLPQFLRVSPAKSADLRLRYGKHCDRAWAGLPSDAASHRRTAGLQGWSEAA